MVLETNIGITTISASSRAQGRGRCMYGILAVMPPGNLKGCWCVPEHDAAASQAALLPRLLLHRISERSFFPV